VDSSYLAFKAHQVLGPRAVAVTAESASMSSRQRRMAAEVLRRIGIAHRTIHSKELDLPEYRANSPNRCFVCRDELFAGMREVAAEFGCAVVVDGLNADDVNDFRPGRRAAAKHGIRSPLLEVGLGKEEIRELSRRAGLPTADEPASACLASRLPYGVPITEEKLRTVDRGEEALREMGFRVFRARHHEDLVRLEFGPEDLAKALNLETARRLTALFKGLGYRYVTLDLEGYRTGSANEALSPGERSAFEG
jgi:uncharacterized protein